MKSNINLLSILYIIILFIISRVNAFNKSNNEDYYMIFVNNIFNDNRTHNNKREEIKQNINELIGEINNIIISNKDTYINLEKLESLKQNNSLSKRGNQNENSDYAFEISSLKDKTVIYSYLSKNVAVMVENIPNVLACVKDRKAYIYSNDKDTNTKNINIDKLNNTLNETQWNDISSRKDADIHLSLFLKENMMVI